MKRFLLVVLALTLALPAAADLKGDLKKFFGMSPVAGETARPDFANGIAVSGSPITVAEFTALDGITAGTVTASKAVVVDANKDIGTFRFLLENAVVAAAAGADQGTATSASAAIVAVTGADGTKGVALPAALVGMRITIVNTSASAILKVYPYTGGQINALGANNAFSLGADKSAVFVATSTTLWYTPGSGAGTSTVAEENVLAGVTAGTAAANKAVVLGASKEIATITSATITTLTSTTAEIGHASDTTLARSGAGAITVEGTQVLLSGAALGTPSSGTLTNATGLPRAGLVEDALARAIGITPLMWQHNTTGAALTVAETAGTHDLAQYYITGEVTDNETEISESQVFFYLPDNYVAAQDIAVTFRALRLGGEDGGAASRIDCELSEMEDGVAVGDQITEAAQVLTATPTTFTFNVTSEASYVAGDLMRLLLITTAVDDVGGTTATAVIADCKILVDVKG